MDDVNVVVNLIFDPFDFRNPKIKVRVGLRVLSRVESLHETVCTLSDPRAGVTLDAHLVVVKQGRHELQLLHQ